MTSRSFHIAALPLLAALAFTAPSARAETIRYGYDTRGRLVTVVRTNTPAPTTTRYSLDRADNRLRKTVTAP